MMDQAHPFAAGAPGGGARASRTSPRMRSPVERRARRARPIEEFQAIAFPPIAGDGDWEAAASRSWSRPAFRQPSSRAWPATPAAAMQPFAQDSSPLGLLERALARQIKVEHGWRTKRRTIALVGAAGAGKTLTAAKLCHAYATGSTIAVRTLSLEPPADAYRLGALTEHLDIGLRVAQTPETARPRGRPDVGREPDRGRHPAGLGDRPGRHRRPGGAARGRPPRRDAPRRAGMGRRPRDRRALRGDHARTSRSPGSRSRGSTRSARSRRRSASRSRSSARSRTSPTAAGRSAGLRPADAAELAGLAAVASTELEAAA